ncbi:MAG TPA: putative quinol monooxygenase [Actinotalea sp.]|nr:putative quinol monooxygenase [Actinotalea sp.]
MICMLVRFRLLDEAAADRFDALTAGAVAEITAKEPGTLVYATHRSRDEPLSRVFYELYRDDEAFAAHERAAHVIEFHARKAELLAGPPEVDVLEPGPQRGLPTP